MSDTNGKKYLTWQWLAGTLVAAVLGIIGYAFVSHDSKINELHTTKADKATVERIENKLDIKADKEDTKRIESKVEDIYRLLIKYNK